MVFSRLAAIREPELRAISRRAVGCIHGLPLQVKPYSTAGPARATQAEESTMRFDLIGERDRFIPGWHCQFEHTPMRAEWSRPEWHWLVRLRAGVAKFAHSAMLLVSAYFPMRRNVGVGLAGAQKRLQVAP